MPKKEDVIDLWGLASVGKTHLIIKRRPGLKNRFVIYSKASSEDTGTHMVDLLNKGAIVVAELEEHEQNVRGKLNPDKLKAV